MAVAAGIPLAPVLVLSAPGGVLAAPRLHRALGSVVNGFRATPSRCCWWRCCLSPGWWSAPPSVCVAAVVPLAVSATPFFARIAEISLREVDRGSVEAAQAMGCGRWHIVWHVLLPEALPGIVGGFVITVVSLIGASAMAGAVGAGGLGDIAIRYGYQRFDTTVMAVVIVLLIGPVSPVQWAGTAGCAICGHADRPIAVPIGSP